VVLAAPVHPFARELAISPADPDAATPGISLELGGASDSSNFLPGPPNGFPGYPGVSDGC